MPISHILIDCTNAYKNYKHSLWAYITNNYIEETSNCLPITIGTSPTIIDCQQASQFSASDIDACVEFIAKHHKLLQEFANDEMCHHSFLNLLQSQILCHNPNAKFYNESCILYDMELAEYVELSPQKTGLTVSVFADQSAFIIKRQPLILYFINGVDNSNRLDVIPISVSSNPEIMINHVKLNINDNELEEIKSWIVRNHDILIAHANNKIDYFQFIKRLQ